jgi:hypothetical protein
MTPPSYMAYVIIGGVVLCSFLAWPIVGFDDAWFVPLTVLPFALLYAAFDRKLRADERDHGPVNQGH